MSIERALLLLSGGLDSAVCLGLASVAACRPAQGPQAGAGKAITALSFDYGQRHHAELNAAKKLTQAFQVREHIIMPLPLDLWGGSALTDHSIAVPETPTQDIPITYVPARNLIFLSIAASLAETKGISSIYIGVNAIDYSGYPDCRPAFIEAFDKAANLGTACGQTEKKLSIKTPLIHLKKSEIITLGHQLGVPFELTVSCYQATDEGLACGKCDSCCIRKQGFTSADIADPTRYV